MNVDFMRKVDHFVGVPLCFVGTIVRKLSAFLFPPRTDLGPRNILLIELSEMGSTILADPAMQKLKRELKANLFFAIFRKNRPSLELLGTVPRENIYTIDESSFSSLTADAVNFLSWTRKNSIDTVIDMELFSRFTALLAGFSGARRIVGFHAFYNEGLYRGGFLTHRVVYNPHQHMSKNFIALVNALIGDHDEVPCSKVRISNDETHLRTLAVSETSKEEMRQRVRSICPAYGAGPGRIVLFNANASDLLPIRRWPREHYITLARTILENYRDVLILLTGSREDHAWLEVISSYPRQRAVRQLQRPDEAFGAAGIVRGERLYAEQRFRTAALRVGDRNADVRLFRPRNTESLSSAGQCNADLRGSRLFALCLGGEPPQDRMH